MLFRSVSKPHNTGFDTAKTIVYSTIGRFLTFTKSTRIAFSTTFFVHDGCFAALGTKIAYAGHLLRFKSAIAGRGIFYGGQPFAKILASFAQIFGQYLPNAICQRADAFCAKSQRAAAPDSAELADNFFDPVTG